jgi:AcrR family transcriptional regulator
VATRASQDGTTAERIARVARDPVVAEGSGAVTMRRVAAAVGVTPMSVYRHYPDREALPAHVADTAFAELAARFDRPRTGDLEQRTHGMLDDLLDVALGEPHLLAHVFTDPRPGARRLPAEAGDSPTLRLVAGSLPEGMATGRFRRSDVGELTLIVAATVQGLVMLRHAGRIDLPEDEFRGLCHAGVERILDGLRT